MQNIDPTLRLPAGLHHGIPVARDTRRFAFVYSDRLEIEGAVSGDGIHN